MGGFLVWVWFGLAFLFVFAVVVFACHWFFDWDKVLCGSPGWSKICGNPPASASQMSYSSQLEASVTYFVLFVCLFPRKEAGTWSPASRYLASKIVPRCVSAS